MKGIIFGVGHYWEMVKPHLTDRLEVLSYMDNNVKFCLGGAKYFCHSNGKS